MNNHDEIYRQAEAYDIAFSFRDLDIECDFLTGLFENQSGLPPVSFLELAAGPALHTRAFAKRGLNACALDLSPHMVKYGLDQARADGVTIRYEQGDMTDFDLETEFDLVVLPMASISYLLDNDAVLANLNCVANHLTPGGLYIIELEHPRDLFGVGRSTGTEWETTRGNKTVKMMWGKPDDEFDPITQISQTTAVTTVIVDGVSETFEEVAPQRCFTALEFDALVRASNRLEIAELFGAMHADVPFSNEKQSWRMVPVLKLA